MGAFGKFDVNTGLDKKNHYKNMFKNIIGETEEGKIVEFSGEHYDLDCLVMDATRNIFEGFLIKDKSGKIIKGIKKILFVELIKD